MSLNVPSQSPDPSAPPSPNTLATRLAEFDLPPPSALNGPGPTSPGAASESIAERLSKLNLPPPEEIRKAERTGRARRNTDDVTEEIANMDFGIPEGVRLGRHPSLGKKQHYKKDADIPHTTLNVDDKLLALPESEVTSPITPTQGV